jgi:hypothetical protein
MTMHSTPQDDDPSGMTDFEKNATSGALEDLDEPSPANRDAVRNIEREKHGDRGSGDEPDFRREDSRGRGGAAAIGTRPV